MAVYRRIPPSPHRGIRNYLLHSLRGEGVTIYRTPREVGDTEDPLVEVREVAPPGAPGFAPAPDPLPLTWVIEPAPAPPPG